MTYLIPKELNPKGIKVINNKKSWLSYKWLSYGMIAGLVIAVLIVAIGPFRIKMYFQSWHTSGYGASWLVVQYSANGDVINYWELKKTAVCNEPQSDGIYFVDRDGNIIHISGHYTYVEVKNKNWDSVKRRYLKQRN